MSYSFNPFDLLDENGGDRPRKQAPKQPTPAKPATDAPRAQQAATQAKAAPAKSAPAAGGAAVAGKRENDAKARPQGDAQRPRGAGKEGGAGKRSPAGQPRQQQQGGAPAAPRGGNDAAADNAGEKPRERRDRDHRTHDRPPQRGRQYDRRSGTGRPANENKKGGSGKGNWGTVEEGQETEVSKVEGEAEKEENAAPAEGEAAATEPPKEPEKEYLSLDEYLATKKKQPIAGIEAPKLRAAGEGVDSSAWADYAPLEKDEDANPSLKKKKDAKKAAAQPTNGKDEKVSVDKLFRVTMPPHEGSESRGRGRGKGPGGFNNKGGRGGGGRQGQGQGQQGGQRPGDRKQKTDANVALADQLQFPSLGGSGGVQAPAAAQAPAAQAAAAAQAPPAQSAPAPVKA